jgi:uncharacterized protein (DUF302 family)
VINDHIGSAVGRSRIRPETSYGQGKAHQQGAELTPYHFSVTLHETFESAVTKTKEALAVNGFGIVSEIDMAATIQEKLGIEHDPYLILGACNPGFANTAVNRAPSIGVLLPCNVVVRTDADDEVIVDFMDPTVVLDLVGEDGIHDIADEVRTRLEMTRDAIATA